MPNWAAIRSNRSRIRSRRSAECRPTVSAAMRLPAADSSVTRSKSRSCASAGRYISSPSASHAVGTLGVKTRSRSAFGQSKRRSIGTSRRCATAYGAVLIQRGRLVLEHLGLVDFVHRGAGRPLQPVGA